MKKLYLPIALLAISTLFLSQACESDSRKPIMEELADVTNVIVQSSASINQEIPVAIEYAINGTTCYQFKNLAKSLHENSIIYQVVLNHNGNSACSDDFIKFIIRDTIEFSQPSDYFLLFNDSRFSNILL